MSATLSREKKHAIVSSLARGRSLHLTADRTHIDVGTVRAVGSEYGWPDLGKLAKASDELRRSPDATKATAASEPKAARTVQGDGLTPEERSVCRLWALSEGHEVGRQGRIKQVILDAWNDAGRPTVVLQHTSEIEPEVDEEAAPGPECQSADAEPSSDATAPEASNSDEGIEGIAPIEDGEPCPTCSGPIRETVDMVCQTCGTDYALAPWESVVPSVPDRAFTDCHCSHSIVQHHADKESRFDWGRCGAPACSCQEYRRHGATPPADDGIVDAEIQCADGCLLPTNHRDDCITNNLDAEALLAACDDTGDEDLARKAEHVRSCLLDLAQGLARWQVATPLRSRVETLRQELADAEAELARLTTDAA